MPARILCIGVAVQDFVYFIDEMPVRAEKHRAHDFMSVGGGCAATAAVAVARLGGQALLATRLGDDPVASQIVAELEGFGVDCSLSRRFPGAKSSIASVFVDAAGERMIVSYRDPAIPADPSWLPDIASIGVDAVLADTRWPEGAARCMSEARGQGRPTILDAERPVRAAAEAVRAASHVAFSRQGFEDWTGGITDLPAQVEAAARDLGAFACVTDGARGVAWAHETRSGHVSAPQVDVVDTLGAGDTWHGAFALALGEGRSEEEAMRFANAAASLKCARRGGRLGVPTRDEVDGLMRQAA